MTKLPLAATKILNAVASNKAQFDEGTEMEQLPALTGIAGASTIRNGLAALKKQSLVIVVAKVAHATPKGMDCADLSAVAELPKTNQEHHETIKTVRKLKTKEIELFDKLSDGRVHSKNDIRKAMGIGGDSTWRNLMTALKKRGILEYPGKGGLQLTKKMFPFEPRPV